MRWKMNRLHKFSGVPKPTLSALSVAVRAAEGAGEIIREGYYQAQEIEEKHHGDLVSQIDVKCDHVVFESIRSSYPNDQIISEELNPDTEEPVHRFWVVDPLDGTEAYLYRVAKDMPSVMIALCDDKGAELSVVYFPLTDDLFYAIRGHGAYEGRRQLHCKDTELSRAWVELNQYADSKYESPVFKTTRENLRRPSGARLVTTNPPHSGSGVRIAEGDKKLAAVIHDNGVDWIKQGPWDVMPIALILKEAGGAIINFKGKPYDPFKPEPFIMAASSKLAEHIAGLQSVK